MSPGQSQLPFGSEASTIFGNIGMAGLFQAAGTSAEPTKKRSRPSTKNQEQSQKQRKLKVT